MKKIIFLLTLLFVWQSIAGGQSAYRNNAALAEKLAQWAARHPGLIKLAPIATSAGKNKIECVIISKGKAESHPGLLIVAGVDGADLISTEAALQFVQDLLAQADVDSVAALLNKTTFYIVPRLNADAAQGFFAVPQLEQNTNAQPVDDDVDGQADEDGPEDLDRNGCITLMRVTDPEGDFVADDKDPRLMRRPNRDKGEGGVYKLFPEGRDNDADGRYNEDGKGGIHFSRHFPFAYQNFASGSGPYPLASAECRGLADFCFQHANIVAVFTFSKYDNVFHPWPVRKEKENPGAHRHGENKPLTAVPAADAAILNQIGERFKSMTNAKDPLPALQPAGDLAQWAYYHYGRWSWAAPAWWPPNAKSNKDSSAAKEQKAKPQESDSLAGERRLLHWLQSANIDGFVDWQEISHPDFPGQKVEVGGFKPYVGLNPPPDSLAQVSRRFNVFFLHLASLLPQTAVEQIRIEPLHERVFRIEAVVSNKGFLPTNSELARRVNWVQKTVAELQWPESVNLLSGLRRQIIDAIPGNGSRRLSWVVSGRAGQKLTLRITGPVGLAAEQSCTLP